MQENFTRIKVKVGTFRVVRTFQDRNEISGIPFIVSKKISLEYYTFILCKLFPLLLNMLNKR